MLKKWTLSVLVIALSVPFFTAAQPSPPFSLKNAEGDSMSLEDFAGKPLVLHFWASWCPYCNKLQPGLQRLSTDYAQQGLVVLGVNFSEDAGVQPQAVLQQRGMTFQTLLEGDEVAHSYGVKGTPTTFFIGRDGSIVGVTTTSDPLAPELDELAKLIVR